MTDPNLGNPLGRQQSSGDKSSRLEQAKVGHWQRLGSYKVLEDLNFLKSFVRRSQHANGHHQML